MAKRLKIPIKSESEIRKMRKAGEAASEVLQATAKFIQPGRTTGEIDQHAAELIAERALRDPSSSTNPRPLNFNDCRQLFDAALQGSIELTPA